MSAPERPESDFQYDSDLQYEIQQIQAGEQRRSDDSKPPRAEQEQDDDCADDRDQTERTDSRHEAQTETQRKHSPEQDDKSSQDETEEEDTRPWKVRAREFVLTHRKQVWIASAAVAVLIIGAIVLIMYLRTYESTDDAQVDGHLNAIASRVSGTVSGVYVEDNQYVTAGQLLVELDARDYQTVLDQANGAYASAQAQLQAENPNVPITRTTNQSDVLSQNAEVASATAGVAAAQQSYQARASALREAEANNVKAQHDLARYTPLVQRDEITREQYDAAVAAAKTRAASVEGARADLQAAQKSVEESQQRLQQAQIRYAAMQKNTPRTLQIRQANVQGRQGAVLSSKAQRDQAELNLSYTRIYAPVSGIVSSKTVEVGERIEPGQQLLIVSQLDDIWVTANFKETQLRKMQPGQAVKIHVDTFAKDYRGYIENLPGATGAKTSLLPPENATGNYVKVVQRLPVRIRFYGDQDPQHQLRPGMSVEPKVYLKQQTR